MTRPRAAAAQLGYAAVFAVACPVIVAVGVAALIVAAWQRRKGR